MLFLFAFRERTSLFLSLSLSLSPFSFSPKAPLGVSRAIVFSGDKVKKGGERHFLGAHFGAPWGEEPDEPAIEKDEDEALRNEEKAVGGLRPDDDQTSVWDSIPR